MSNAFAAQARGSPPGSLTTCAATRDGNISASPSSTVKFSMSAANAAISSVSMARAARAAGIRAEAFSWLSCRSCKIKARPPALAWKNMSLISAASLGCIDKFDAIRNCTSLDGFTGGAVEQVAGISGASGTRWSGLAGFSPSFLATSTGVPG